MIAKNIGYRQVELRWRLNHAVKEYDLFRKTSTVWMRVARTTNSYYVDEVPEALSEKIYLYMVQPVSAASYLPETVETSRKDWCARQLPYPVIPEHPEWLEIYRKAWQLTWHGIRCSPSLPAGFAYNDYPDCDITYLLLSVVPALCCNQRGASRSENPG